MLAIRQIHQKNHNNHLTIQLPKDFDCYDAVEIIILPVETQQNKSLTTKEFLARFAGAIPDFPEIEQLPLQELEFD